MEVKPESEEWYEIKEEDFEGIKEAMSGALESADFVQVNQEFPVEVRGERYILRVMDLKSSLPNQRRIPVGRTKFTEVTLNIIPKR